MQDAADAAHAEKIEQLLQRDPLVAFSVYTHIQVTILRDTASQIRAELDAAIGDGSVNGTGMNRVYGLFWLWVLGAYEVLRTMDQATGCFSPAAGRRISEHKRRLATLRMPFAKQERARKHLPISTEASIAGFDFDSRDIQFTIEGKPVSVRSSIEDFELLIGGIARSDVIADHRTSYA